MTSQELEVVRGKIAMTKNSKPKRVQLSKEQLLEQWKAKEKDNKPQTQTKPVDKSLQNTN